MTNEISAAFDSLKDAMAEAIITGQEQEIKALKHAANERGGALTFCFELFAKSRGLDANKIVEYKFGNGYRRGKWKLNKFYFRNTQYILGVKEMGGGREYRITNKTAHRLFQLPDYKNDPDYSGPIFPRWIGRQ